MAVEIKISKEKIPYKTAVNYLEKRVQEVKNGEKDDHDMVNGRDEH